MRYFILPTWLFICVFIWTGYSGGPGNNGVFATGSPTSSGSNEITCAECHSGGNFGTSVKVEVFKSGTTTSPITQYNPGQSYDVRVTVTTSLSVPSGGGYGFQMTAMKNTTKTQAGTFGTPPSGMRVLTANNRQYAEHTTKSSSNTFKIAWAAPAQGTGNVLFYASGNAVNGNGDSSGDKPSDNFTTISERPVGTSAEENVPQKAEFALFPNPSSGQLLVSVANETSSSVRLTVFDLLGRQVQQEDLGAFMGTKMQVLNIQNLAKGTYFMRLQNGNQTQTKVFTKE